MGTGHLRESAWINAAAGQWCLIEEHAEWAKRPGNLTSIGVPDAVREVISDIPNDYFGENRIKILLRAMVAGGIQLRGHGDWVVIEFTWPPSALHACRDVRRRLAGESMLCRFNNPATNESLRLRYGEYERHIERDIDWILPLAAQFEQKPR